ncbi:MAG: VanZ family protein, partial [Candidatus Latescibacterota bacterium]
MRSNRRMEGTAKADRIASRLFFLLALLFIGFIAIASLTPINDANLSLRGTRGGWFGRWPSFEEIVTYHDLRDIATNVLLYIPLGVFLSLAVSWKRAKSIPLWLLVGSAVSFLMEMIQAYVGRHPDPVDIATNTTGYVLGFAMVLVAVKQIGLHPSSFLGLDTASSLDEDTKAIASL